MKKPIKFPKVEWEIKAEKPQGNFYPTIEIKFGFEVKEGELWWRPCVPEVILILGRLGDEEAFQSSFEPVENKKYLYRCVKEHKDVKVCYLTSKEVKFAEGDYCLLFPQNLFDDFTYFCDENGNPCYFLTLLKDGFYSCPEISKKFNAKNKYHLRERLTFETYETEKGQKCAAMLAEILEEAASLFPDIFQDGLEKEKEGFTFYRSSKTKNLSVQVIHNQTEQQVAEFV